MDYSDEYISIGQKREKLLRQIWKKKKREFFKANRIKMKKKREKDKLKGKKGLSGLKLVGVRIQKYSYVNYLKKQFITMLKYFEFMEVGERYMI